MDAVARIVVVARLYAFVAEEDIDAADAPSFDGVGVNEEWRTGGVRAGVENELDGL